MVAADEKALAKQYRDLGVPVTCVELARREQTQADGAFFVHKPSPTWPPGLPVRPHSATASFSHHVARSAAEPPGARGRGSNGADCDHREQNGDVVRSGR